MHHLFRDIPPTTWVSYDGRVSVRWSLRQFSLIVKGWVSWQQTLKQLFSYRRLLGSAFGINTYGLGTGQIWAMGIFETGMALQTWSKLDKWDLPLQTCSDQQQHTGFPGKVVCCRWDSFQVSHFLKRADNRKLFTSGNWGNKFSTLKGKPG